MVLQRMAVLQAVPPSSEPQDEEAATIARLAGAMAADETQLLYSLCLHGRQELGLAPDEYAALTMVLLAILVVTAWRQSDARETVRLDRKAERDHDADLTAYNEMLAKVAQDDRNRGA